jgi:hypothetical protein
MARKPEAVKPDISISGVGIVPRILMDDDEFARAIDLIHSRLDVIEDHLINLGRSMGHIGIPSFKPYSGDEG